MTADFRVDFPKVVFSSERNICRGSRRHFESSFVGENEYLAGIRPLPDSFERRMPQLPILRPGAILGIGDEHRLDEDGVLSFQVYRWRIRPDCLEQLAELDRLRVRPAGSAAADIDELTSPPCRKQQPPDCARHSRRLEANDNEAVAALACDLLPPIAAAAAVRLFPMLGDDAFEAVRAGNAIEFLPIRFDLFR
ncbi:hypothetical protein ABIA16_002587 [Sinorhizobium fredii]